MFEILGSVIGSIFSGGATGILGVVAQRFADYKNKQLDMELEKQRSDAEIARLDKQAAIMAQEWAGRTQVATVEGEAKMDVAASEAFAASFKMEPQKYSGDKLTTNQQWLMVVLDFIRGSVRPALTIYLCVLVTVIYFLARDKLKGEDITAEQAIDLWKLLIGTILYVWTTITLWWFGTRNRMKQPGE